MKTTLDYKNDFLCVLAQYEVLHGRARTSVKEWYPVYQADEAEVRTQLGKPLTETDPDEGTYVDEDGNVFQLAEKGATKAIEVERSSAERKEVGNGRDVVSAGEERTLEESKVSGGKAKRKARLRTRRGDHALRRALVRSRGAQRNGEQEKRESETPAPETVTFAHLNLRQKLAVVRRRIAYVQKRGHNPRFNYNYVTAADIAGAVGDILAELGVVVVPRLESISHEAVRPSAGGTEHATHVVMSYSFLDVDTAEEITVKTAGEGLDSGDKAPYKAMTGALKYALLQSFLLATGDDPEEERSSPANHSSPTPERRSERLITADEVRELRQLIDSTGTELERVLAYYKLASLEGMTEGTYRRAVELLQRKRATQSRREAAHAQNERLHQNTPEWQRWRLEGIGSSDAPVIMGESNFKTPRVLWSIKTGGSTEGSDSPAVRRGRELEQRARSAYEARMGVQMEPACLVHDQLDWMRASLDGFSFDGSIVLEIKCPLSRRDQAAVQEGRISVHYYAQVQHQLEVSRAQEAHYWSFDGTSGILVRAQPDREYIARLMEAEAAFWQRILDNRWPEHSDDELDLDTDPEWRSAAVRYREARTRLDYATVEEQKARKHLEQMATARRTYGGGIEVLRSFRKGTVDYSIVPELVGLDLEPYRKAAVEVVKINLSGRP